MRWRQLITYRRLLTAEEVAHEAMACEDFMRWTELHRWLGCVVLLVFRCGILQSLPAGF